MENEKQYQDQIQGLQAQLEASKQMFNEQLNSNHVLRSQVILMQQECKRLDENVKKLTQKILELTPKITEQDIPIVPESQL